MKYNSDIHSNKNQLDIPPVYTQELGPIYTKVKMVDLGLSYTDVKQVDKCPVKTEGKTLDLSLICTKVKMADSGQGYTILKKSMSGLH